MRQQTTCGTGSLLSALEIIVFEGFQLGGREYTTLRCITGTLPLLIVYRIAVSIQCITVQCSAFRVQGSSLLLDSDSDRTCRNYRNPTRVYRYGHTCMVPCISIE